MKVKIQKRGGPTIADKLWSAIRDTDASWTVPEISKKVKVPAGPTRIYIALLRAYGYVEPVGSIQPETKHAGWTTVYKLVRNTGRRAPRGVKHGGRTVDLWDPNLDPPLPAREIKKIRRELGLTLADFAEAIGWQRTSARHVRSLETGEKPVPPDLAEKIINLT